MGSIVNLKMTFFLQFHLRYKQSDIVSTTRAKFTARFFDTSGKFATGVLKTGGKFAARVVDTGQYRGKFAAGVVDTGSAP
jgi:hypothetical protein